MKFLLKAVLACCLLWPSLTFAQTKVGFVNTTKILEAMPEIKAANARLDSMNKSLQGQLKELYAGYQELAGKATDQASATRAQEAGNRVQAFQENARQEMQKKKEDLMAPILKKVDAAIKATAAEQKCTVILDSGQEGIVLYASEKDDITTAVKKRLGIN